MSAAVATAVRIAPVRALGLLTGLLALGAAACAPKPQAAAPGPRIYAVDVQGRSALCEVPQVMALAAERSVEASMTMHNDGGWCGIATNRAGPGLVTVKPSNGRLHVRKVGATTRVDYIPDRGFVGTDNFAVKLLPDGAEMKVAATVQASPQVATASAAPAPPPPAPAKRAPATRKAASSPR